MNPETAKLLEAVRKMAPQAPHAERVLADLTELLAPAEGNTPNAKKDVARLIIILGDRNGDGPIDVTVQADLKMPLFGWLPRMSITRNVPVDQALAVAQGVAGVLPQPAGGFVATLLGFVRAILNGLR